MGRRSTNAGLPRVALTLGLCALLTLLAPLLLGRDAPPRIDAQELARVVDRQNRTIALLKEQLRRPAAPRRPRTATPRAGAWTKRRLAPGRNHKRRLGRLPAGPEDGLADALDDVVGRF